MNQSHGAAKAANTRFVLLVAGFGGLPYGMDAGIIADDLPYPEAKP